MAGRISKGMKAEWITNINSNSGESKDVLYNMVYIGVCMHISRLSVSCG